MRMSATSRDSLRQSLDVSGMSMACLWQYRIRAMARV